MSTTLPFYLGCPAWSCRDWIGTVFRPEADPSDLLREYARLFNAVEGNTFFYALPPLSTIERWMAETGQGFRFAPKFPKTISHERRLRNATEETKSFMKTLEALADGGRLGLSFLQLPPSFNINHLETLERYLKSLPKDFCFAVEPRHVSWYDQAENERRLDDLLENLGMDKVVFDSRPLFAGTDDDRHEADARQRKPQTPVRMVALGKHPVLRFVGRNTLSENAAWIKEWAPVINKWALEGRKPYIFGHAADDANAPYVARRFHETLCKINPLLPKPAPFESDRPHATHTVEQLNLF